MADVVCTLCGAAGHRPAACPLRRVRERNVEDYARQRVAEMNGEMRKVQWVGRRDAPDDLMGVPGTGLRPPRFALVEFKRPGERPNAHQAREHDRLRRIGVPVVVLDSIEGVDEWLR